MRSLLLFVVACGSSSPPSPVHNAGAPCPDLAAAVPGYPNARRIDELAMATSVNPGMNSASETFEVPDPSTRVIDLFTRCIGAPRRDAGVVVFALPSSRGERTLAIAPHGNATRLTVACTRCY